MMSKPLKEKKMWIIRKDTLALKEKKFCFYPDGPLIKERTGLNGEFFLMQEQISKGQNL